MNIPQNSSHSGLFHQLISKGKEKDRLGNSSSCVKFANLVEFILTYMCIFFHEEMNWFIDDTVDAHSLVFIITNSDSKTDKLYTHVPCKVQFLIYLHNSWVIT